MSEKYKDAGTYINNKFDYLSSVIKTSFHWKGYISTSGALQDELAEAIQGDIWSVINENNLQYVCVIDEHNDKHWESIGNGEVKLDKTEFESQITAYVKTTELNTKLEDYTTKDFINSCNYISAWIETEPAFADVSGNIALSSDVETLLKDYALSAEVYTKIADTKSDLETQINEKISSVFKIKGFLPTFEDLNNSSKTGTPQQGDVWIISNTSNTNDLGIEYVWTKNSTEDTGHWEKLGTTVNVSSLTGNMYSKDEIDALLDNKVTVETGKGLSKNDFTDAYKNTVDTLVANGGQANVIETIKLNNVELTVTNKTVNIDTTGKLDKSQFKDISGSFAIKGTKLSDYGITDAKIDSGTITLGSNTITPLTSYTEKDPEFAKLSGKFALSTEVELLLDTKQDKFTKLDFNVISGTPTTIAGYGIHDAYINTTNGTIKLGDNTITPLTGYDETDPIFAGLSSKFALSSDLLQVATTGWVSTYVDAHIISNEKITELSEEIDALKSRIDSLSN